MTRLKAQTLPSRHGQVQILGDYFHFK